MSAEDNFIGGLENLLEKVPKNYGLKEWRHLIRLVVYTVCMRVLRTFPEIIVGPPRDVQAGGPTPPPHPNVGRLLCIVTGDCPPPPSTTITPTD
jgi:hypothetical protein